MAVIIKEQGMSQFIDTMHRISRKLPDTADKDLWNVSQMLGAELRKGMDMAGIQDFKGTLRRGTVPRKSDKYTYQMLLPRHAHWLDSMKPHEVWIYDKPELQEWMKQRGFSEPFLPFQSIFVRPRPFIEGSFDRLRQRLAPELENGETIKMIRRKGR